MKLIFLGDVVGEPGRDTIQAALQILRNRFSPDFIVINGENSAGGSGITPKIAIDLMRSGADVVTLGDHAWDQREILPFFYQEPRLIRPLNYPEGTPGCGSVVVSGNGKKLGVINLLGRTFMTPQVDNPFLIVESEIQRIRMETPLIMIDFHAEATSEKIAFGRSVDGQVTLVVGTHTHVQTADDQILPGGTAYITDAGFCGPHESVIGRDIASVVQKYKTLLPNKFYIARQGLQADGVYVEADDVTGKAIKIVRIQEKIILES
jgi:metallophosphoesterase (TIGR00282 family)